MHMMAPIRAGTLTVGATVAKSIPEDAGYRAR